MKVANLSKIKNELSQYVEHARRGERVRILVRGVPAADLVPVGTDQRSGDEDWNLEELERRGVIRRGKGGMPEELLRAGPKGRGKPLSQVIIEERRSSRR